MHSRQALARIQAQPKQPDAILDKKKPNLGESWADKNKNCGESVKDHKMRLI